MPNSVTSRVLPRPPGPTTVTSRAVATRSASTPSSSSRPTIVVGAATRLCRSAGNTRSGGNAVARPGRGRLQQLHGLVEITDPVATERPQQASSRTGDLLGGRCGHHDLATMGGVDHSRRLVDSERDVVVTVRRGETGVQSHPHSDRRVIGPRLGRELALRTDARVDGGDRIGKRDEERITFRLHLPARAAPRGAQDLAMPLEQHGVPVADPPEELCGSLDVGERERHQARRERPVRPRHALSIVRPAASLRRRVRRLEQ